MFASARRLRELGVIGMNDRNINLIARLNPRDLYPLVDDKLRTKLLAQEHGIPTPGLIGALRTQHDLRNFRDIIGDHAGFAMKPAKGSGGKGILALCRLSALPYLRSKVGARSADIIFDLKEFY